MTRRELVETLTARRPHLANREAEMIVNTMLDAMAAALARGERIEIRGFGSFGVKHRRARLGRNPKTGAAVAVDAKRMPFFRPGKELRVDLNGAEKALRHSG